MRDWLVILVIGLASLGLGFWAVRRRPLPGPAVRSPEPATAIAASTSPRAQAARQIPSTKIEPHPDDVPLATLEFEGPPGRVAIHRIESVIGRHSSDDVSVADVRVSRHHARLVKATADSFEIHNLTAVRSEPNPMLVNGEPREHATLRDGGVVSLGGVNFKFRLGAG